jgi:putative hemolysin
MEQIPSEETVRLLHNLLETNRVKMELGQRDRKRLKMDRPVLFIANHTWGEVEEWALLSQLLEVGHPVRILSERIPAEPVLRPYYHRPVGNSLLGTEAYADNICQALQQLTREGFSVLLCLHFTDRSLDTLVRNRLLNKLMKRIRQVQVPMVPIRLKSPIPTFLRPGLGSKVAMRLHRGEPLRLVIRVGSPITVPEQQKFEKAGELRRFLQSRIFSLGTELDVPVFYAIRQLFRREGQPLALADPVPAEVVREEIGRLSPDQRIAAQGPYDILIAEARQIPHTLREIGRLREQTFREVGEGTGKSFDLDEYDLYYHQLILWHRETGEIAGGYRMGLGDVIFERYGANGFYISSLFRIGKGFFPILPAAVELGRSFVVPAHQRQRLPLFLLWKGILYFLFKNPQYRYLYGPVSISKYYSNISRGLIVAFIRKYYFDHDLAAHLRPRKPFRFKVDKVDVEMLASHLGEELQSLDSLIEDIEPAHIRMPVLVRQYLKLKARFISFNVDPNFSDVLDGFILLNWKDIPADVLEALRKEV